MPRGAANREGMKLTMSDKERDRLAAIRAVDAGQLTQKQAAEQLGISSRQVRRSLKRYREDGDAGLLHKSRGRPSNRRTEAEIKEQVRALIEAHYRDFGPTLTSQMLEERHGIQVSAETLRRWKAKWGLHKPRRRKVAHHRWRERRPCFGALLQVDGSRHPWLEGRGEVEPELMGAIDDATGQVFLQFAPAETTEAMMRLLRDYITLHGRPVSIYADRHSIYQTNRKATVEEQLQGLASETQLGRALRELGIEYIAAHSPQAKGRIERSFRTFQDRLIKQMRLEGICDIDGANRFLKERFIEAHNARFAVEPASDHDAHRSAGSFDLDAILSHQETRTVTNDYTISYDNTRYQIARESVVAGLRGAMVIVERRLDGSIHVRFGDRYLTVIQLPPRQPKVNQRKPRKERGERTKVIPAADHPWRRGYQQMPDGPIYP